jgi:hypothetical protein
MRPPPEEVPTLTEVVGFSESSGVASTQPSAAVAAELPNAPVVTPLHALPSSILGSMGAAASAQSEALHPMTADALGAAWLAVDEDQLTQRVLLDVQRQVDRMFEFRVRESIGPAVARLIDAFLSDTRDELNRTLRDVVRRAVAQELAKHRSR